eukprot:scaffold3863_cov59-Phaeocystis_antarctica.AAC.4
MQRAARVRCGLASDKAPVRQQQRDDVGAEVEQGCLRPKPDDGAHANCVGLGLRGRLPADATTVEGGELQHTVDGHLTQDRKPSRSSHARQRRVLRPRRARRALLAPEI